MNTRQTLDLIRRDPSEEYELLQRVGSGTYGDVYKAIHRHTREMAAVKLVKIEKGDDFSLIHQEIVMMRECRHPNIIAYYSSYLKQNSLWIVMEYCGGGSLQDIYHMTGPLTELQIAFVCRETLRGLLYLHTLGKIHRDVKGANILLSENGEVKLADFGVAAQITMTLGKRKSFIGTPYWMAPEVAAVERKGGYNHLCDVWAVGITAIELAELQPPLFDLHPLRVLVLMSKSSYKPPCLKDKIKWSPSFHEFVRHCLTKSPKKRPTADRLLVSCPFLQGNLTTRLTRDLLDRVNNPSTRTYDNLEEEAGSSSQLSSAIPRRIPSREHDVPNKASDLLPVNQCRSRLVEKLWPDETNAAEETSNLKKFSNLSNQLSLLELVDKELRDRNSNGISKNQKRTLYEDSETRPTNTPDLVPDQDRTLKPTDSQNGGHISLSLGGASSSSDSDPYEPVVKPRRRKRPSSRPSESGTSGTSANGTVSCRPVSQLPATPQVHMGACLLKIFNGCPLKVNCTASWVHSETQEQHVLIGAEEGIYTLNLNKLHDAMMDRIHPRRCIWMHVTKNVLLSIQGKTQYLYRHDLVALHQRDLTLKLSLPMNKVPEKFVPRKLAITTRIPETKDCFKCCTARNLCNGYEYLAAAVPKGLILMQWYDPLSKYMILKQVEIGIPPNLSFFEMIVTPEDEYPRILIRIRKGHDKKHLQFDCIDLNNATADQVTSFPDEEMIRDKIVNVTAFKQLDKDLVVLAYENSVLVTNLKGRLKSNRLAPSEFEFPFYITHLVFLTDSVLAFHEHGVQGRSFIDSQVTQDVNETSRMYRVLGSDKIVVLESRPSNDLTNSTNSNLHVLTGHEAF